MKRSDGATTPRATASAPSGPRRLGTWVGVLVLLVAAVIVILWEPWHGPIIVSLSSTHGVDAGDVLVLPLLGTAVALYHRGRRDPASRSWRPARWAARLAGALCAVVLGMLLVLVGYVYVDDGALVPAGGATLGQRVQFVGGSHSSPVGVWSHEAVTYDGSTLRLYVDGRQAASQATTGSIQATMNPLWIGGNHPYGEYFNGVIDEVRVYDRALDEEQIRADMATALASTTTGIPGPASAERRLAAGLVAAYSFDAGSGSVAVDASGDGNAGELHGATWTTEGRYGNALRFDGDGDVVMVQWSPSLNLTSAMTLSAWIRPSSAQTGWRTIVQREVDAYFLHASSDVDTQIAGIDDLLAGLMAVAGASFSVVIVTTRGVWLGRRRRRWRLGVALLLAGCVADAVVAPVGTLFAPVLAASWFAATSSRRVEAVAGWLAAAVFAAATIASVAGLAEVADPMMRAEGGVARAATFGALLVMIGLLRVFSPPDPDDRDGLDSGKNQSGFSPASG